MKKKNFITNVREMTHLEKKHLGLRCLIYTTLLADLTLSLSNLDSMNPSSFAVAGMVALVGAVAAFMDRHIVERSKNNIRHEGVSLIADATNAYVEAKRHELSLIHVREEEWLETLEHPYPSLYDWATAECQKEIICIAKSMALTGKSVDYFNIGSYLQSSDLIEEGLKKRKYDLNDALTNWYPKPEAKIEHTI